MGIQQPIDETDREFVGSLAKGLSVLRVFGRDNPEMSSSDVAKATGTTRAAARRFLLTLHALGYVDFDGRLFRLSAKTLEVAHSYLSSNAWLGNVSPALERLKATLSESVSLTVLDRAEIIYVMRFPADKVMTLSMEVGSRRPAFCTAMGRVLMSALPEAEAKQILGTSELKSYTASTVTDPAELMAIIGKARHQGYALINQELEDGLVAVSVPLRNASGRVIAAVNVCGHASQLTLDDLEKRCLPALQDCVARLSPTLFT